VIECTQLRCGQHLQAKVLYFFFMLQIREALHDCFFRKLVVCISSMQRLGLPYFEKKLEVINLKHKNCTRLVLFLSLLASNIGSSYSRLGCVVLWGHTHNTTL
jgi:hypothetical protein